MEEVKSQLGISETNNDSSNFSNFGSNDVFNLSWKNILDAYTCTECGRCTEVCPANLTGKKLSPRKIMMDIRDRADEVGKKLDSGDLSFCVDKNLPLSSTNFSDNLSLFSSISPEEIHACTTCNACVEACPVLINPLEPILKMRRYEILTMSSGPADWVPLFNSLENNQAAWSLSTDRAAWTSDLND
jgi:Fe-S oxidoreductase